MPIAYVCDLCEETATITIYLEGHPIGHRCGECFAALEHQVAEDAMLLDLDGAAEQIQPHWGPKRGLC